MKKWLPVLAIVLAGCGKEYKTTATVVEKSYTPSSVSTGVGPVVGGKGGVSVTTSVSPEHYTLFVRYSDGSSEPKDVSKDFWLAAQKGDVVVMTCNTVWGCEVESRQ